MLEYNPRAGEWTKKEWDEAEVEKKEKEVAFEKKV